MVVFIQKKKLERHLGFSALFLVFVMGMALILWQGRAEIEAFAAQSQPQRPTLVLDPGHGGEDGGAVAADGTVESGLNLDVARRVETLFAFLGQETVMTRTEDVSIYSAGAETLHQKKVSDLQNRVALVNKLENAVLLSIHQNSLPSSPKTYGAQVFFNSVPGADSLALSLQNALNLGVDAGNEKTAKRISDTIYLTKNVTAPAVIVECGFLSNSGDTAALKDAAYQLRLASAIAAGYLSTEELP